MTDHTGTWVLDPAGSTATFVAKAMWGLQTVKGTFGTLSGRGTVAADGTATGSLVIAASSVDTKNPRRDTHLKSADFFNAEAYPSITLTVTSATAHGGKLSGTATLSAAGSSEPVMFEAAISEDTASAVTLTAQLPVNYRELGMTWNRLGMMGGTANASVTARFTRAEPID